MAIWFALLRLTFLTAGFVREHDSTSLPRLQEHDLGPGAAQLLDIITEAENLDTLTEELLNSRPRNQLLDLYNLAVIVLDALFDQRCPADLSQQWSIFARLTCPDPKSTSAADMVRDSVTVGQYTYPDR